MAGVQIRRLTKHFEKTQVLHGIDVDIDDGSFVVLVGPSGCGKSTLLRSIAGLEDVSGGEIRIGDRVVNDVAPKDRDIAMVFQSYALYPHKTVEDNMGFALKMAGASRDKIAAAVQAAAQTLNLGPYMARYPRELSGGQRQRVAMGRCIVRQPSVFLFDEPLSNLDAKLRTRMRTEIKALHQRLGVTSIYVTHDQMEAMTMADRIVVMRDGRVEQVGAPLELYDRPHSIFVAAFVGSPSINLFEGTLERRDGRPCARFADGLLLPVPDSAAVQGQAVTVGIRPEHLRPGDAGQGLVARVTVVEPTGSETIVTAEGGGRSLQFVVRERLRLAAGDSVALQLAPGAIHLFDTATGLRLETPAAA